MIHTGPGARSLRAVPLPRLVDTVLDRLVVPGWSRLGYAARSAGWRTPPSMAGRTVIVTGASGGLGAAAALGLAGLGARVEMVVRDQGRGEQARDAVLAEHPGASVDVAVCDVSSLADVRRYAAEVRDREAAVHGLVHNAGVLPAERTETAEGHELTFATHVLGPFLLTRELRPVLRAGAGPTTPSRVVLVSSGGMYTTPLRLDDPESRTGRGGVRPHEADAGGARRAARRRPGRRRRRRAQHAPGLGRHPGVASSLPGFHRLTGPLLHTPAQGADTVDWLQAAAEPGHSTGLFWHDRAPRPTHRLRRGDETPQFRAALWTLCVDATRS